MVLHYSHYFSWKCCKQVSVHTRTPVKEKGVCQIPINDTDMTLYSVVNSHKCWKLFSKARLLVMEIVNVVVNYGISPNIGSLLEVMCLTFVPDKPTSRCQTLHFM
jgi:hypothetical protein